MAVGGGSDDDPEGTEETGFFSDPGNRRRPAPGSDRAPVSLSPAPLLVAEREARREAGVAATGVVGGAAGEQIDPR